MWTIIFGEMEPGTSHEDAAERAKREWLSVVARGDYLKVLRWHAGALIVNLAVALAILFAVGFVCEWRIRRKSARTPASGP
jgi:hypothetical protein